MKKLTAFLMLVLAALAGYAGAQLSLRNLDISAPAHKETAYERVMRTGTIRCGYTVWAPYFMKDINTGKFSGIWYDITEELGKSLNMKIEWVEETSIGDSVTALQSNRFDMFCSDAWPTATAGKYAEFSHPAFYVALGAVVRANDTRFDNSLKKINSPNITLSTMEGEMTAIIARSSFPKAKLLELPALTDVSLMIENVATGKADVTFIDRITAAEYMKNNPSKIRYVPADRPIRLFGDALAVRLGEADLMKMVNTALVELIQNGIVEDILNKYETVPDTFYRAAKPYEAPQ